MDTGGQVYRRYSFLCGPLWPCAGLPHRLPERPLSAQYLHGSAAQPHAEAALAIRRLAGHDIHPRLRFARCNTQTTRLLAIICDDRPRAYEHVGCVYSPRSLPAARATLRAKMLSARCTCSVHNPLSKLSAFGLRRSSFVFHPHLNTRPALLSSERLGRLTASRDSHLQTRAQRPPRAMRLAALQAAILLRAIPRRSGKLDGNCNALCSPHPADPPTLRAHCGRLLTHTHGSHRAPAPAPKPGSTSARARCRCRCRCRPPTILSCLPFFLYYYLSPSFRPSVRPSLPPSSLAPFTYSRSSLASLAPFLPLTRRYRGAAHGRLL
ncbi:hypothetical protein DFH08DRAFT_1013288 [Mycena albidolilacea]|uniref:Uncharacterized protein n=1 Tax=Mycena albidolilacea TaxID=1033008 RepID=A0AAD6ZU45_9AGAR|nr:hypothetical protein DFH08DRAFT_1013288 [Mycena albidolilacea]